MSPAAPRRGVLIVDDTPDILRCLVVCMSRAGWDAVAVPSGERALEVFSAGAFRLAICDVDLGPGMDGLETARRMRAADPALKTIFITGSADHARRAAAESRAPVVMKPFSPSILLALADHAL